MADSDDTRAAMSDVAADAQAAYSLWLVAERETQDRLTDLVAVLAPRFATRAFTPHVTIQGNLRRRLKDVRGVAAALAEGTAVQQAPVRGIERSTHYYRAFYLAFERLDAFAPLARGSAQAFATDEGLSPFPHLSLAYGALDDDARDALAREVAAEIPASIVFDRLAVALSGSSVGIASWRVIETFALAPAHGATGES
jgi:Cyclic phosphodiesterase-like protein